MLRNGPIHEAGGQMPTAAIDQPAGRGRGTPREKKLRDWRRGQAKRIKGGTVKKYLVIALYEDNDQRYATTVEADSPEGAEAGAQMQAAEDNGFEGDPLIIAGVLLDGEVVA